MNTASEIQSGTPRRNDAVSRLVREDDGAVFLEFLIVLFPFMFILFGVAQTGLMVMASFYTNYANFMVMRTYSVQLDQYQNGFISSSELSRRGRLSAIAALGPIEPSVYRNYYRPINRGGVATGKGTEWREGASMRIRAYFEPSSDQIEGKPVSMRSRLEYEYPLIVPFAGGVIAALASGATPGPERVMHEFVTEGPKPSSRLAFPSIVLKSSNDARDANTTQGGRPYKHDMLIQRRWLY